MDTMWPSDREPAVQAIKRFMFWGNIVTLVVGLTILATQGQFT